MYESGDVDYDDEGDDDDNDDDENDEDDDWEREKLISLWQLRRFCSRDPIGGGRRWHATLIDHHRHCRHVHCHHHHHMQIIDNCSGRKLP